MGPTSREKASQEDTKALLREKDNRIATLETRLEAYTARASTAHTRLLKTVDVLDALRSQHALEISTEELAKMKLLQEVNRWRSMAKNLEVEKDELKDVVEDLIEKVVCTSRNMQRGNLNIEFPDQVAPSVIHNGGVKDDRNSDLLTYATSIIARLRTELDVERQNHGRTVEEANLRIEELEAKVAVREAELERYVTSPGDNERQLGEPQNAPTQSFGKQKREQRILTPKPLSDEECLRFLESNGARNRSLELEIRQIAERLEQARLCASTSSGSHLGAQSPSVRNGHQVIPTRSPRARSASVDPSALSRPLEAGNGTTPPVPTSPSTTLSIAQLDNQIRTMSTQMDALVSERTTLIEAAAKQRRVTEGINTDTFQDILRVEGECVRLQAEVDDLREQLQQARSFARAREKALLREIAELRASSSSAVPAPDLHNIFSPQPLEDNIAPEESMELASPLMPTVVPNVLPARSGQNVHSEADLVSLTFSPRSMSSPAPEALPTSPRTMPRSLVPQDIERVQAALDVARSHLAQKEEALVQLRAEMARLQLEVQAQNQGDGDGG